jgi:CRISPR-associated protein Csc1
VLPAWPVDGRVTFRFERFNALSDAYWYAMTNNRVATAREDVPLQRLTGKNLIHLEPVIFLKLDAYE